MIRFLDEKFTKNKTRYILQCLLATSAVFIVLFVLDAKTNTAVIAALGASSFIAFTMPHARVSRTRYLVGGYLVGVCSGFLCYHASLHSFGEEVAMTSSLSYAVFGGLSVGLAIFVMVLTDTEHPPAAGVALGLVLNDCQPRTILVVLVGIVTLALIKRLLRPVLINLL